MRSVPDGARVRRRLGSGIAGLLALLVGVIVATAQERPAATTIPSREPHPQAQEVLEPEVDYLPHAPEIDGRLDSGLESLPRRDLPFVWNQPVSEAADPPRVGFRLGYGAGFLYAHVEVEADSLTFRDRAYQNGDGFVLVIGAPRPGNRGTEEFYALAGSAVGSPSQEWARRVFWYFNVEHLFRPLGEGARLEFHDGEGTIAFELLLPWTEIRPYHPWLSPEIGFNLIVARAVPEGAAIHAAVPDTRYDSEMHDRLYARLRFAEPAEGGPAAFVQLDRNHTRAGEALAARLEVHVPDAPAETPAAVSVADSLDVEVTVTVRTGEGDRAARWRESLRVPPGRSAHTIPLPFSDLPTGGYAVEWRVDPGLGTGHAGWTILPRAELAFAGLERAGPPGTPPGGAHREDAVSEGARATLQFLGDELQERIAALRPYETCGAQRLRLIAWMREAGQVAAGEDPYASRTGLFRRAFRSAIDGTLQPYMLHVPDGPAPPQGRPLMVFLHGSGSDETALAHWTQLVPEGWLAVAPRGRGTSHAWSTPDSQRDIAEAVADARRGYAVDPDRIVLAGFSMGGYGVLRTHWEDPTPWRALVVVAGHPDLANAYLGRGDGGHPDFLDARFLAPFSGVPVFLTHGELDRNCPWEMATRWVDALRRAGARVEFVADPTRGHQAPSAETVAILHRWLEGTVSAR